MDRPLWGDFHNHNGVGYGKGSVERSYAIARGSLLDTYCFTPHGLWHDMPANDPEMAEFHRLGFEHVCREWPVLKRVANDQNKPGEFAAFLGFEWHSSEYGDYHVLLPGAEGDICSPNSLSELQAFARSHNAIMIPHHFAYAQGWRGAKWSEYDSEVSPVACVFSEHGSSMESEFNMPMVLHSMGGSERSQTMMAELRRGRVCGVVGSTDNHWGHPASYSEGLAGVWAESISREAVLDALRRRHTYAVTGDRIELRVSMADGVMGDVMPADTCRTLEVNTKALGAVDYIRIIKNGIGVYDHHPGNYCPNDGVYTLRCDFGWDSMGSEDVTRWMGRLKVDSGRILSVCPCFCGGSGSVELLNRILSVLDSEVSFEAFTSRRNSRPQSGIVLRIEGRPGTTVELETEAEWKGRSCGARIKASVDELAHRDYWDAVSDVFSSPRIRLGQLHSSSETDSSFAWEDPDPSFDDWYMLKVLQCNGQAAWSSPIWCHDKV